MMPCSFGRTSVEWSVRRIGCRMSPFFLNYYPQCTPFVGDAFGIINSRRESLLPIYFSACPFSIFFLLSTSNSGLQYPPCLIITQVRFSSPARIQTSVLKPGKRTFIIGFVSYAPTTLRGRLYHDLNPVSLFQTTSRIAVSGPRLSIISAYSLRIPVW